MIAQNIAFGVIAATMVGAAIRLVTTQNVVRAALFLGGWYLPGIGPSRQLADVIGPFVLGAKIMLVAFLIYWIRFTYPRLREDQLQTFAWKYLIPLSLVNILVTGILKVVF